MVLQMLSGRMIAAFHAGVRGSVPTLSRTVEAVFTISEEVSVLRVYSEFSLH
jgi:copper oxidase (laccase) domain-containing protein